MQWKTLSGFTPAVLALSLIGCGSAAKTHEHSDAQHDRQVSDQAQAETPAPVELVGTPGMDDPIPARSVEIMAMGLSCPLCAHNLDKQLMKIEGVESVDVDLSTGSVRLAFTETACVTPKQLVDAVNNAGFSVTKVRAIHVDPGTSDTPGEGGRADAKP